MIDNQQTEYQYQHFLISEPPQTPPNINASSGKTFGEIVNSINSSSISVLLAQSLSSGLSKVRQRIGGGNLALNYQEFRQFIRSCEYMITIFGMKLIIDQINQKSQYNLTEYQKGGISGLITYLLNRPLDQIQYAKRQILKNQNKKISRLQGWRVVLKYDGFKGFYKYENLLAPASSYIYRSTYFGFYQKLSKISNHPINLYFFFPLCAATTAFCSSFLLDFCRNLYLSIHKAKDQSLQKRTLKDQMKMINVTQQFFDCLARNDYKHIKINPWNIIIGIFKNSLFLSLFTFSQSAKITSIFQLNNKLVN